MKKETIPSLDLNNFTKGDQQSRENFSKHLERVLKNMGL